MQLICSYSNMLKYEKRKLAIESMHYEVSTFQIEIILNRVYKNMQLHIYKIILMIVLRNMGHYLI